MEHITVSLDRVRDSMMEWFGALMAEGRLTLPIRGTVPGEPAPPCLVLLPYQVVLESQASVPTRALVPSGVDAPKDTGIPAPWVMLARAMTDLLLEAYPQRPTKAPGLGPLDPCPPLSKLPAPLQRWYQSHGDAWVVQRTNARLPSVSWRQPFSYAIRYAAMVVDTEGRALDLDRLRLTALATTAAGIRHRRFFQTAMPPEPVEEELETLIEAMRDSASEPLAQRLSEALEAARAPRETAVGLFPHNELSDADLAAVMRSLQQPMQPAVVFALRLSLGGGAELLPGAAPHIPPAQIAERAP